MTTTDKLPVIDGRKYLIGKDPSAHECRGWYIVDQVSTHFYLHRDGTLSFGIKDQELGFWPTSAAAEEFLRSLAPVASKERLGPGDAPGWYECEYLALDSRPKHVFWWTGSQLLERPGSRTEMDMASYGNFRGLVVQGGGE